MAASAVLTTRTGPIAGRQPAWAISTWAGTGTGRIRRCSPRMARALNAILNLDLGQEAERMVRTEIRNALG